jgi:hypothetical protein
MLRKLFFSVILVLGFPACYSQLPDDFPVIDKNDLPDGKFSPSRIFNGTSLFGYINGGAELYLEYGFSAVSVTEIDYSGGIYKTEIYKMTGPEAAFGIFSVSKYRCLDMPALSEFTCRTKYQLQICKGPYYISIINRKGARSDSIASIRIGKIITDKIKEGEIDFSGYLPDIFAETIQSKCFLAKGRLGIVNGSPDLEDYFNGVRDYTAVVVRGETSTILSVKFKNFESLAEFTSRHNWNADDFSAAGSGVPSGETVKKLADNHLYIEK